MKKAILLIALGLFSFYSCKKNTNEAVQKSPETTAPKVELYSSAEVKSYLNFDKEFNEYEIVEVKDPQKFSAKELAFTVKENEFDYNKSKDFDYYIIKTFDLGDVNFKVILYNSFGENDIKVVNIQLNSYRSGAMLDALLLDCRFEFETEYYRNFVIKNDRTIEIKKIEVDKLEYNKKGDIIGNRKVNDTIVTNVMYKINPQGTFIPL